MAKVTGAFMFRHEGDGCLTSKYFNNTLDISLMECCKLITKNINESDNFCGQYNTVWLERPSDPSIQGQLEISKKSPELFKLDWVDINNKKYYGEGMITCELLIGWYEDV